MPSPPLGEFWLPASDVDGTTQVWSLYKGTGHQQVLQPSQDPGPGLRHLLLLYCSSVWWVISLFTCTASCMRARSMSWPGAWSEPGSITQGLGETPPQSLQTAPNDSDQRTHASPAESLRYNINKDAEDSSSYLSDLIFLKLAWLMLFIFHCSWLIFTKFSRQHLCLFLASLKPSGLA